MTHGSILVPAPYENAQASEASYILISRNLSDMSTKQSAEQSYADDDQLDPIGHIYYQGV